MTSPTYYAIYNPAVDRFEETTSFAKIVRARLRGNYNAVVVTPSDESPRELNASELSLINQAIAAYKSQG